MAWPCLALRRRGESDRAVSDYEAAIRLNPKTNVHRPKDNRRVRVLPFAIDVGFKLMLAKNGPKFTSNPFLAAIT